jgi:DNA polymerase (family 10)
VRAYAGAADGIKALESDDLAPLLQSGELGTVRGLGPATLAVVRDLVETGESRYLEQLRATVPEGLIEMLDVPGLTTARVQRIHQDLGIETIEELEAAAKDGRLAALPRFGLKTAAKILDGIAFVRRSGSARLYNHAAHEAARMLDAVRSHPDVERAEIAGAIRRHTEVASTVEIVASCRGEPSKVAQTFARLAGVRAAAGDGADVSIEFVDGAKLRLLCVGAECFGVAWWSATGNADHVAQVVERLAANGVTVSSDNMLLDSSGRQVDGRDEVSVYRAAGLSYVEPELREGLGEVDAAARDALPRLVAVSDIRGSLHNHTHYSDGKASVAEMAQAARDRGWSYIGITDHSPAAGFAVGMPREKILAQHDQIDELNASFADFRILKGIEADILSDGRLDECDGLLDSFDFVVGSVHSRFSMDRAAMTERILRAMSDPRLTILGHPTGRKLLARDAYPVDVDAVLQEAARLHIAVELNSDPRRLDLDWRYLRTARALGVKVEIGPDAHSTTALDNMTVGVHIARKAWLERADVLNAGSAEDVLAFARARGTIV